jgi:RNA ligase
MSLEEIRLRDELVDQGYLKRDEWNGFVLYNYTDKCTFDKHWNRVTLNSRGIVFDKETGECVARPFPKFFNLGEHSSTFYGNLPDLPYQAYDKLDGSLGILVQSDRVDFPFIVTRGCFNSTQAEVANNMLWDTYKMPATHIPRDVTLLFEIIYPANKIVVPYGDRAELVVLGGYDRFTGRELCRAELETIAADAKFPIAEPMYGTINQLVDAATHMPYTTEGFVVRFDNGLRVKIKGTDYLRVHKMISHLGPISVWEALKSGKFIDMLTQLPEEFRAEAETISQRLYKQHQLLASDITHMIAKYGVSILNEWDEDARSEAYQLAARIKGAPAAYQKFLFQYMRGKPLTPMIWDAIRPTGNEYRLTM